LQASGQAGLWEVAGLTLMLMVLRLDDHPDLAIAGSRAPAPTSSNQAPVTMKTNDDIIPRPTAYRPQAPPKKRTTAPACSTIRHA
jgi:hypothetical protein